MSITDERFGAELVTRRGRIYRFDSVECMAAFVQEHIAAAEVHSLWVTDWGDPPRLVPVDDVVFLHSPTLRSPMGLGLAALSAPAGGAAPAGAQHMDWPGVLAYVAREWPGGRPRPGMHGH